MNYEQKYKEALEKAREIIKDYENRGLKDNLLYANEDFGAIFPELKESEDERIRKWLIDTIKSVPNDSIEWDVINKSDVLAWLEKQGEQKSECSEEDEKIRQTIINEFEQCSEWYCSNGLTKEDCINWLKKQEYFKWGDEDNENMNSLCVLLDQMVSINAIGNEHSIEYKNWLKSLKQRHTWKPSEEQIKAIRLARAFVTDDFSETQSLSEKLIELEEQLKKLRDGSMENDR